MGGGLRGSVLLLTSAILLTACGDGDPGDPVVESAPATDDATIDAEDVEEMRDQLAELARGAEEQRPEAVEQDPDAPLLLPADVVVTGDLEGTYTDNPGCDVASQYVDPEDGHHEDVLSVSFGWAGHTFDWTSDVPDDARPLSVVVNAPSFDGAGSYDAFVTLAGVEVWAHGTAQLTIVENRREEFPTGEIVVIEGELSGTWSGEAGSGEIAGDLGVCNVRLP